MDKTPPNYSDSGYNSSVTFNSSVKCHLDFNSYDNTSRKRKLRCSRKLSNILEERPYGNCSQSDTDDECFQDDAYLSSSLDKCSIDEYHTPGKKYKWNQTEKSNSEPSTPQRNKNSTFNLTKYHSLDLSPRKESLKLLYPKIREVKRPTKRLFHCTDFVCIFTRIENVNHIIKDIFSYLSDADLINVAKVSKLWLKTLKSDEETYNRYKSYLDSITIKKENIYEGSTILQSKKNLQCVPRPAIGSTSPSRVNWAKFASVGAVLDDSERLVKCIICERPAILKRGLARCSGPNCGYLWCVGCLVGGCSPELIDCRCNTPHSPPSPLNNKSNLNDNSMLIELNYFEPEKAKSHVLNDLNVPKKTSNSTINSFNISEHRDKIYRAKKTLSSRKTRIAEPASPPNVKAGSKQSKKNLRRLLF